MAFFNVRLMDAQKSHGGFSARHGRIDRMSENSRDYGLKRTQSISMWLPLRMLT